MDLTDASAIVTGGAGDDYGDALGDHLVGQVVIVSMRAHQVRDQVEESRKLPSISGFVGIATLGGDRTLS